MATDEIIPGIVKNGVVVPQADSKLPEGTHVDIVVQHDELTPELKEELQAWQLAGTEAWQLIDTWESEDQ